MGYISEIWGILLFVNITAQWVPLGVHQCIAVLGRCKVLTMNRLGKRRLLSVVICVSIEA